MYTTTGTAPDPPYTSKCRKPRSMARVSFSMVEEQQTRVAEVICPVLTLIQTVKSRLTITSPCIGSVWTTAHKWVSGVTCQYSFSKPSSVMNVAEPTLSRQTFTFLRSVQKREEPPDKHSPASTPLMGMQSTFNSIGWRIN